MSGCGICIALLFDYTILSSSDEPAKVDAASKSEVSSNQPKSDPGLDAYLVPHFTKEEQKQALALMVRAHSAGLLPPTMTFLNSVSTLTSFLREDTLCHSCTSH